MLKTALIHHYLLQEMKQALIKECDQVLTDIEVEGPESLLIDPEDSDDLVIQISRIREEAPHHKLLKEVVQQLQDLHGHDEEFCRFIFEFFERTPPVNMLGTFKIQSIELTVSNRFQGEVSQGVLFEETQDLEVTALRIERISKISDMVEMLIDIFQEHCDGDVDYFINVIAKFLKFQPEKDAIDIPDPV